jgi:capsular exopolysaccharide synthesis family protein
VQLPPELANGERDLLSELPSPSASARWLKQIRAAGRAAEVSPGMGMPIDSDRTPESPEQPLELRRVLDALRRRRLSIVVLTGLALIPGLFLALSKPDVYEATAKVAIQRPPKVMELGPDYMPSGPTARGQTHATEALLLSDAVLGRVVDRIRSGSDAPTAQARSARGWLSEWRSAPELSPDQRRTTRIGGIRGSLTLDHEGAGTVLAISARGRDAAYAAALANAVAEAFVGYRGEQRGAALRRATAWLGQRILELRERMQRQEEAVASLVVNAGIVPSEADQHRDASRAKLMEEVLTARIDLLTIQARLAELGGSGGRHVPERNHEDYAILTEHYSKARAEFEVARLRYTPTHPELARLEAVVSSLRRRVESELGPGVEDGLHTERIRESRALRSQESLVKARVAVLERELDELAERAGPDSEALATYKRKERELAIDRQMHEVLLRRRNETLLATATEYPDARVLDPAVAPVHPAGPNRRKLLVIGAGLALSFGLGIGLLREMLDRRVRDPEEAESILNVPFLGVIPRTPHGTPPEEQTRDGYAAPASESYRNLRTALLFSTNGSTNGSPVQSKLGTLVVTSGVAGEGKTTISANLAESFAHAGWKVLLGDADLRRSRVHRILGLDRTPGLTELLRGELGLAGIIHRPADVGFDVITSGAASQRPAELLSSRLFELLLSRMKQSYELVLLDSPVLLAVPDALLLTAQADATFLVHKPGALETQALARIRTDLERARARVLGFVFNQVEPRNRTLYPAYLRSTYEPPPDLA